MTEEAEGDEIMQNQGAAVVRHMLDVEIVPVEHEEEEPSRFNMCSPFAKLSTLGVGLSSLPKVTRTITRTVSSGGGEALYRCVFPNGVSGMFAQFKDGTSFLGAIMEHGIKGQARWVPYSQARPP